MLTDAEIAKMPDEEKSALLHSLMKHHTGPTEGLVASLTSRLAGLQDLLGKPEPVDTVAQRISESLKHDETVYMLAINALGSMGHDMTVMYHQAARTIGFAQEVIATLAAKKLGVELPKHEAPCLPGTPAAAPCCSPSPQPSDNGMEPCNDETL